MSALYVSALERAVVQNAADYEAFCAELGAGGKSAASSDHLSKCADPNADHVDEVGLLEGVVVRSRPFGDDRFALFNPRISKAFEGLLVALGNVFQEVSHKVQRRHRVHIGEARQVGFFHRFGSFWLSIGREPRVGGGGQTASADEGGAP